MATRLTPGADLDEIPGGTWNGFCDWSDRSAAYLNRPGTRPTSHNAAVIVKVKNASGVTVKPGYPLAISGTPLPVNSTGTPKLVYGKPLLSGVTPVDPTHFRSFVICNNYVTNGKLLDATIAGPAWARVNRTDATHKFAKLKDGEATYLKSGSSGVPVEYFELQDESGDDRLGEQWALVILGVAAGGADAPGIAWAVVISSFAARGVDLSVDEAGEGTYGLIDADGSTGDELDGLNRLSHSITEGTLGEVRTDSDGNTWFLPLDC